MLRQADQVCPQATPTRRLHVVAGRYLYTDHFISYTHLKRETPQKTENEKTLHSKDTAGLACTCCPLLPADCYRRGVHNLSSASLRSCTSYPARKLARHPTNIQHDPCPSSQQAKLHVSFFVLASFSDFRFPPLRESVLIVKPYLTSQQTASQLYRKTSDPDPVLQRPAGCCCQRTINATLARKLENPKLP